MIKTISYWYSVRVRYINQWNTTENPEKVIHVWPIAFFFFNQTAKTTTNGLQQVDTQKTPIDIYNSKWIKDLQKLKL